LIFDCSILFTGNQIGDDGRLALADAVAVHPIKLGECLYFELLSDHFQQNILRLEQHSKSRNNQLLIELRIGKKMKITEIDLSECEDLRAIRSGIGRVEGIKIETTTRHFKDPISSSRDLQGRI